MKKAIVTGANGFIGTELCKQLLQSGVEVLAVVKDRESNVDNIINLQGIQIVYCDMHNFGELSSIISDKVFDVFFHLAWAGTSGNDRGDYEIQISNIESTCDAVKLCSKIKCSRFVFASSIMEYEIESIVKQEKVPNINALYSTAKLSADYMARILAGNLGVEYIRAVISNVYGPGENSQRMVNTTLRKLLSNEYCKFSAGEQMYDFIYITDAVKAFMAIAEKGIMNRTYYIGSLSPRPLKEFLFEMRDLVNPEIEIGLGELEFNGVSLTYKEFDVEAIKNDTGFVPEVDFVTGIKNTIAYLREEMLC